MNTKCTHRRTFVEVEPVAVEAAPAWPSNRDLLAACLVLANALICSLWVLCGQLAG